MAPQHSIRREHAESHPGLVAELVTMFRAAKDAAGPLAIPDPYLIGREPLQPVIELALRYAAQQSLLPGQLRLAEVWDGGPVA